MDFKTDYMSQKGVFTLIMTMGSLLISYVETITIYLRFILMLLSVLLVILQLWRQFKSKNNSNHE